MIPAVASPAEASRSTTTTLAALLAKASVVARPMPFPAPVISATLPVKSRFMAFLPSVHALAPWTPACAGVTRTSFAADLPGPLLKRDEQIANEAAADLVGERALGVEL